MQGEFLSIETAEKLAKLERDNKSLIDSNKKLYKKVQKQQELERYKNIVDKATNYLLDKYVTGKLDDEEVNNVVKILKGE